MDILKEAAIFLLQLSVILLAARIFGEIALRLKQPAVLGELAAGMIIGPFALGAHIVIPGHGALFPRLSESGLPISTNLFNIAELAAVILLFMAGLETNLKKFLRYAGPAFLIATGGVALPFFFGVWASSFFGLPWNSPPALFMGAIMTATSVGITARVLGDIKKLDTAEGVTILAGAVIDDVLGILVLTIVIAISRAETGHMNQVGVIALKAIGFWVGIFIIGLALAKPIEKMIRLFKSHAAPLVIALILCFIASALAEFAGLAMIIGAYAMGLALSNRPIAREVVQGLESIFHFLVPIFFVVTGMFVNIGAMRGAIAFGVVITILAIIGKFIGCGLPALGLRFNKIGALRIGVGMVPRGEVALIIALIGIASQIIDQRIYGVAVMMTLVTTFIAPIALGPVFKYGGKKVPPPGAEAVELAEEVERLKELEE